jgi:hypothetical protein
MSEYRWAEEAESIGEAGQSGDWLLLLLDEVVMGLKSFSGIPNEWVSETVK